MKKYLLVYCILLVTSAFGQESDHPEIRKIIGVHDSAGVQFVRLNRTPPITTSNGTVFTYYYLYWNNNQDSIPIPVPDSFLPKFAYHSPAFLPTDERDTCKISVKQLDQQGLPEVIIEHTKNNGTSTTIINLDSSQVLFKARNAYFVYYPLDTHYGNDRNNYSGCGYSYEIRFEGNRLIIQNLKQQGGLNPDPRKQHPGKRDYMFPGCLPDKNEGVYILENGSYIYSKERKQSFR